MHLAHDYIHPYRGYWSDGGKCRIYVGAAGDGPVVICSELPDNENTSVTNMAEYLAAEIMRSHSLPAGRFVWIEHYPSESRGGDEETFDLVTFSHHEPEEVFSGGVWRYRLGTPQWKSLDRATVEVLAGQPV